MTFSGRLLPSAVQPLRRVLAVLPLLVTACLPLAARSAPTVDWDISGFASLGVLRQQGGHDWGFVRNSAQLGASGHTSATPDSRAGLQLDLELGDQWEATLQGVLLPRPSGTPVRESLERAYIAYRPRVDTRLRLGRTSPDTFLFSDSRHVGFALPWVRPPVDFYSFFPVASIDGGEVEQRWQRGDTTWRARLAAGSMQTSVTDGSGGRLAMRGRDLAAFSLTREQDGLLLKLSYIRGRLDMDAGAEADQLRGALSDLAALPLPALSAAVQQLQPNVWSGGPMSYLAFGAQYEIGPWTWLAEASDLRVPNSPLSARRGYFSAGYRLGDVTLYGMASRVVPRQPAVAEPDLAGLVAPLLGPDAAQQVQDVARYATAAADNYRYDQRTVGVGLRWDFAPTAALKLQVDRFRVHPNGGAGWRFADTRGARVTVCSVVVDMVWGQ